MTRDPDPHITYSLDTDLTVGEITEMLGDFAVDYNVDLIVAVYNNHLAELRRRPPYFRHAESRPAALRDMFWHLTEVYDTTCDNYAENLADCAAAAQAGPVHDTLARTMPADSAPAPLLAPETNLGTPTAEL
ncbi:hypothetical protein ACWDUL_20590 [Nocardia niigatensis]